MVLFPNIFVSSLLFLVIYVNAQKSASTNGQQEKQFKFGNADSIINSPMWNTCLDLQGNRRQNGEEWTVRQHFVMLCHRVPSDVGQVMRAKTIACLRQDGQTRIPVGSEAEEQPGWTLVCRREPTTGEVRREWRIAGERRVPINGPVGNILSSSSGSVSCLGPGGASCGVGLGEQFETSRSSFASSSMGMGARMFAIRSAMDASQTSDKQQMSSQIPVDGVLVGGAGMFGCFDRPIGTRFQHRSFEMECTSQMEFPKLIACLPPELNGEKVPAGETKNVGPFTVICEQRVDGTYAWRWYTTPWQGEATDKQKINQK